MTSDSEREKYQHDYDREQEKRRKMGELRQTFEDARQRAHEQGQPS